MSDGWQRCHRRHDLTQAVLADVAGSGTPTITASRRAQVEAEYGTVTGFLRELQYRWYRQFTARLDATFETEHDGVDHAAVRRLWHQLSSEQPAMWLLLHAHRDEPALATSEAAHRATLRASGIEEIGFTTEPRPAKRRTTHLEPTTPGPVSHHHRPPPVRPGHPALPDE